MTDEQANKRIDDLHDNMESWEGSLKELRQDIANQSATVKVILTVSKLLIVPVCALLVGCGVSIYSNTHLTKQVVNITETINEFLKEGMLGKIDRNTSDIAEHYREAHSEHRSIRNEIDSLKTLIHSKHTTVIQDADQQVTIIYKAPAELETYIERLNSRQPIRPHQVNTISKKDY